MNQQHMIPLNANKRMQFSQSNHPSQSARPVFHSPKAQYHFNLLQVGQKPGSVNPRNQNRGFQHPIKPTSFKSSNYTNNFQPGPRNQGHPQEQNNLLNHKTNNVSYTALPRNYERRQYEPKIVHNRSSDSIHMPHYRQNSNEQFYWKQIKDTNKTAVQNNFPQRQNPSIKVQVNQKVSNNNLMKNHEQFTKFNHNSTNLQNFQKPTLKIRQNSNNRNSEDTRNNMKFYNNQQINVESETHIKNLKSNGYDTKKDELKDYSNLGNKNYSTLNFNARSSRIDRSKNSEYTSQDIMDLLQLSPKKDNKMADYDFPVKNRQNRVISSNFQSSYATNKEETVKKYSPSKIQPLDISYSKKKFETLQKYDNKPQLSYDKEPLISQKISGIDKKKQIQYSYQKFLDNVVFEQKKETFKQIQNQNSYEEMKTNEVHENQLEKMKAEQQIEFIYNLQHNDKRVAEILKSQKMGQSQVKQMNLGSNESYQQSKINSERLQSDDTSNNVIEEKAMKKQNASLSPSKIMPIGIPLVNQEQQNQQTQTEKQQKSGKIVQQEVLQQNQQPDQSSLIYKQEIISLNQKIQNLELENSNLQQQSSLTSSDNQKIALFQRIQILQLENSHLKEQNQSSSRTDNQRTVLNQKIERLQLENSNLQQQNKSAMFFEKQKIALNQKIQRLELENSNLLESNQSSLLFEKQKIVLNQKIQKLQLENSNLQYLKETYEAKIQKLEEKMQKYEAQERSFKAESQLAKYNSLDWSSRQKSYQQEIDRLSKKISLLQSSENLAREKTFNAEGSSQTFDDILRAQIKQNLEQKQKINEHVEEIQKLHEIIQFNRRKAEEAIGVSGVQKLKFLSEIKQLQQKSEIALLNKDNQISSLRHSMETLQSKLKVAINENRTKDKFLQQYLVGRVSNQEDKQYVKKILNDYHTQFNVDRIGEKIIEQQKQIAQLKALLAAKE